jgi:hypothetical protein
MNLIGSPRPGPKKNLKNWPTAALSFLAAAPHRGLPTQLALIETKGLVSTLDVDFLDHVVV